MKFRKKPYQVVEEIYGKLPKQIEYRECRGELRSYHRYVEMVKLVAKFNPKAAEFLCELSIFGKNFIYSDELLECFIFDRTEQGYDYWFAVANTVERMQQYANRRKIYCWGKFI